MSDSLLWIQWGPILLPSLLACGFGIGIYPAYSCPETSEIRSALARCLFFYFFDSLLVDSLSPALGKLGEVARFRFLRGRRQPLQQL